MSNLEIPLLPLHTVLFPDGSLPLRVFEPRYIDMISSCLRNETRFGVCLIREGQEIGEVARTHEMGTIASIYDWNMRADGLLGISVRGERRFKILSEEIKQDQLLVANVEILPDEQKCSVPEAQHMLVEVLHDMIEQMQGKFKESPVHYSDATWVGFRLAELLPLKLSQKQYFLQLSDPHLRLERLADVMDTLQLQT